MQKPKKAGGQSSQQSNFNANFNRERPSVERDLETQAKHELVDFDRDSYVAVYGRPSEFLMD